MNEKVVHCRLEKYLNCQTTQYIAIHEVVKASNHKVVKASKQERYKMVFPRASERPSKQQTHSLSQRQKSINFRGIPVRPRSRIICAFSSPELYVNMKKRRALRSRQLRGNVTLRYAIYEHYTERLKQLAQRAQSSISFFHFKQLLTNAILESQCERGRQICKGSRPGIYVIDDNVVIGGRFMLKSRQLQVIFTGLIIPCSFVSIQSP